MELPMTIVCVSIASDVVLDVVIVDDEVVVLVDPDDMGIGIVIGIDMPSMIA